MKRLTWIIFVIVLIIFAYETFRPQAKFPPASAEASVTRAVAATEVVPAQLS